MSGHRPGKLFAGSSTSKASVIGRYVVCAHTAVRQRDFDLVALAGIAHEGGAHRGSRRVAGAAPDNSLCLGNHGVEASVLIASTSICLEKRVLAAHDLKRYRRVQESRWRSRHPDRAAPGCATHRPERATRVACSGPLPPKAIIVRPPRSLPLSTACMRPALAMLSSTIRLTPSADCPASSVKRLSNPLDKGFCGRIRRSERTALRQGCPASM